MHIFSYCTPGVYSDIAENALLPSIRRYNLAYHLNRVPDKGSWGKNSRLKPSLIAEELKYSNDGVLYIDADAVLLRAIDPTFFDKLRCVAAVDFRGMYLGGTLYFPHVQRSFAFLDFWLTQLQEHPDWDDQRCFNECTFPAGYDLYPMPFEYCWVESMMRQYSPHAKPIINHMFLSGGSGAHMLMRENAHQ